MDVKQKSDAYDDPEYRAMFNIPEPGTEPNFGIFGGPLVMLGAILVPLAILGGIHQLLN